MPSNPDKLYASKKIFQDYINRRDTIRRVAESPNLTFTPKQEKRVVTMARKQFRQREMTEFKRWLCRFFSETNLYFSSIKIMSWPMMRGLR